MKLKKALFVLVAVMAVLSITAGALAEEGQLFRRNISKTPEAETEKAALYMMDFYVPAQASTGGLVSIDNYILADGTTVAYEPRDFAKPLVSVWIDNIGEPVVSPENMISAQGGITFGEFDAFVGISLDDGTTWKTTNLSRSHDLSSFNLRNGTAYPGDVHNVQAQVFGDNIFVAWASKYCEGGSPLFALDPVVDADYLTSLEDDATYGKDAVYLYDFFSVAGSQGSVDYTLQGYPEIGEIPFSCIWTARGKLLAGDDPSTGEFETTHVMWTKPERLTAGVRDANLPAVDCAGGAGCILTWQEDPDGLRPGQGLGPGEGWSGAVAWQQTDIWYSHISQADFDKVFAAEDQFDGGITMAEYLLSDDNTMPKSYVPMAMPVRLTDNAMCKGINDTDPYCYIDFDTLDDVDHTNVSTLLALAAPEEDADFCSTTEPWTNSGGVTMDICVTEDNRLLNGKVAATRVRMNLKPYDSDGDTVNDSAWIVMAAEESKGLGDILIDEDPIDIGKDVWYYSFDPFKTGADVSMVMQGGMLNQPAQCNFDAGAPDPLCDGKIEGEFYPLQYDLRPDAYPFYLTEIARRFALTTNSVTSAMESESGLAGMLIYKQGIINQGGPADIFLRRLILPDGFDPNVNNPYAFENMECAEWAYADGSNPNYVQGVCLSPAINITANTIVRCDSGSGSDACADTFPMNDDGSNNVDGDFPKVYEWRQCDGVAAIEGCEDDNDLDDQSWENPFDVAKGHRGFLDGDIVLIMYAWAPNWNSNAVGNDHYNLYARRSFDGGATWTTTPALLGGEGITVTDYNYGTSIGDAIEVEYTYGAGDFEQGRNMSLLTGNQVTVLDPRYSPTGGTKLVSTIRTDWLTANSISFEGLPYEDDLARDPSKYFIVYETGDNTTVAEGEATPLDLFYSRATVYGDVYETMDYITDKDDEILDRWPWLENKHDILSGEASMLVNPGGTFMYAVWNQWQEEFFEDGTELVYNSDILFRRLMYSTDEVVEGTNLAAVIDLIYPDIDALPTYDQTMDVDLYVSARDLDKMGEGEDIVEYEWTVDGQVVDDDSPYAGNIEDSGQHFNAPPRTLSNGWHGFSVRAKDNEGHWSKSVTFSIQMVEDLSIPTEPTGDYKIFLPLNFGR